MIERRRQTGEVLFQSSGEMALKHDQRLQSRTKPLGSLLNIAL